MSQHNHLNLTSEEVKADIGQTAIQLEAPSYLCSRQREPIIMSEPIVISDSDDDDAPPPRRSAPLTSIGPHASSQLPRTPAKEKKRVKSKTACTTANTKRQEPHDKTGSSPRPTKKLAITTPDPLLQSSLSLRTQSRSGVTGKSPNSSLTLVTALQPQSEMVPMAQFLAAQQATRDAQEEVTSLKDKLALTRKTPELEDTKEKLNRVLEDIKNRDVRIESLVGELHDNELVRYELQSENSKLKNDMKQALIAKIAGDANLVSLKKELHDAELARDELGTAGIKVKARLASVEEKIRGLDDMKKKLNQGLEEKKADQARIKWLETQLHDVEVVRDEQETDNIKLKEELVGCREKIQELEGRLSTIIPPASREVWDEVIASLMPFE